MKKTFVLILFAGFFLAASSKLALAANTPNLIPPQGITILNQELGRIRQKVETRLAKEKEKLETLKNKTAESLRAEEKKKLLIRSYFNQMVLRLEAYADRLEKVIQRLETRLAKVEKEKDTNADDIRQQLAAERTKLAEARAGIEQAKKSLDLILESDNRGAIFLEVRSLIKTIKSQLLTIRLSLAKIVVKIENVRLTE